jgi:hypothetical protein
MNAKHPVVHKQALASFLLLIASILLLTSGLPLHFAAASRNGTGYHVLMTIHNASALIFVAAALAHVYWNRRSIRSRFLREAENFLRPRKELTAALAIAVGVVAFALSHLFH